MPLLTLIVFTPLAGALVVMLTPKEQHAALRRGAFIFSLLPFALSLVLLAQFNPADVGFQFTRPSMTPRSKICHAQVEKTTVGRTKRKSYSSST